MWTRSLYLNPLFYWGVHIYLEGGVFYDADMKHETVPSCSLQLALGCKVRNKIVYLLSEYIRSEIYTKLLIYADKMYNE